MIHGQFQAKQHVSWYTTALQLIRARDATRSHASAPGRAPFQRELGPYMFVHHIDKNRRNNSLENTSSSFAQRVTSKNMAKNGEILGKGKERERVPDANK